MQRLVEEGRYALTREHLQLEGGVSLPAPQRETVARALCQYLATSGEFTYTLVLRRHDATIDPTLDFLVNVRQGHCERYAAALALLLRSLGVPTRIVKGFRGAEPQGDGTYVVRHSHAHSWVEALVPARALDGQLAWLTLDPTPGQGAGTGDSLEWSQFWRAGLNKAENLWKALIVNSNPDQQREAVAALWSWLAPGQRVESLGEWVRDSYSGRFWGKTGFWLLTLAAGLILYRLARRLHFVTARGKGGPVRVGFYDHLLRILARRCGLVPQPAQTPREFGAAARRLLEQKAVPAALAELPPRVAGLFYQVRFGRHDLAEAESREIDRQLDQLDWTLAAIRL
jgi:hypothetical protein